MDKQILFITCFRSCIDIINEYSHNNMHLEIIINLVFYLTHAFKLFLDRLELGGSGVWKLDNDENVLDESRTHTSPETTW